MRDTRDNLTIGARRRFLKAGAAGVLICGISACSTFGGAPGSVAPGFDLTDAELSQLIVAVNAPAQLVPVTQGSSIALHVSMPDGQTQQVVGALVRAANTDITGQLPAPAIGRGFFLFELDAESRETLSSLQARQGEAVSAVGAGAHRTEIKLRFCTTAQINVQTATYSVFAALPERPGLLPLVSQRRLEEEMQATGQDALPDCASFL